MQFYSSPLDQRSPPCPRQPNLWREQIRVSSDFMSHNREDMNETSSPAANIIWTTVPIDAGPPRRMTLCACMPTYPPEASSPPPERTRQLQQSPNSGFLVACGVTGLDCSGSGGGFDMFRLKCVISKRIQVTKAPWYWYLVSLKSNAV